MTSQLPFGLKSKPTRRYVDGCSLSYTLSNGKLFCILTKTTQQGKYVISKFEVKSKEQLGKLLKAESFSEIQTIEVVHQ